ncbi:MAG: hypothetical protein M1150_01540 [Patescibacteria group bacterium]|nr:hypothetical protein [Patescibacteria group bacterium]
MNFSKKSLIKFGLSLLAILIVAMGSYYLGTKMSQKPDTPTSSTEEPANRSSGSESTETYRSSAYGYTISYPKDWKTAEKIKTVSSGDSIYTRFSGNTGWIQINIGNQPLETSGSNPPSVRKTNINIDGVSVEATEVVFKDETGYLVAQLEQNKIQYDIRFGNTETTNPHYDKDKENLLRIISTFKFTK